MPAHGRCPRLMLVTDARRSRLPLLELAAATVAGGVDALYLRDVDLPASELADLVRRLRERAGAAVTIVVNDGPERAKCAGTGLHLRERDMATTDARAALGADAVIGRSVHTPEGAAAAIGADYVLAGHVYPSASKPNLPPLGLDGLADIAAAAPGPVLAIGGITPERVAEVIRAGASGVAVIGALAEADEPRAAAAFLRAALDDALLRKVKD
ncbi:MAG: thiamine phosphate synthase [Thermomicrobiales bacterium]